MNRLAATVVPGASLASAVERVRLAERLGYEAVFTIQLAARDALMTLAPYAAATSTIKLGTAVLPAFPRHPVSLGIEAATLDEISGGRLILGIGPSHQLTMESWYGIDMARPLSRMKEYVQILRSIFVRGGASFSGDFYNVQFGFLGYGARKDLPIYLSALSPNMLRWAGSVADGVLLWACLPGYIRDVVVPTVRAGAADAGRDPDTVEIAAAVPTALTDDPVSAAHAFRADFYTYMNLPFYRRVIEAAGYGAEIREFDKANEAGDFNGALAAISDRLIEEFCAVGDAAAIADKLGDFREAGVTLPIVGAFDAGTGWAGPDATLKAAIGAAID